KIEQPVRNIALTLSERLVDKMVDKLFDRLFVKIEAKYNELKASKIVFFHLSTVSFLYSSCKPSYVLISSKAETIIPLKKNTH
ncbi:TPA: hypothetical protein ACQMP0_001737, partial [Streptococcus pyogenes]